MMEKTKNLFAVLGLVWVINILTYLTFPQAMLVWHTHGENVWFLMTGSLRGNMGFRAWLMAFSVVPACMILLVLFAGIGVIKKARA